MYPARTRHITTIGITAAALAVAIGTATPALADPPPGHGNGNAPSVPPGQAKQSTSPASAAPSAATAAPTAASSSATRTPPGQAKKAGSGHTLGVRTAPGQAKRPSAAGTNEGHGNGNGANGPSGHNPPGNNGTVKIHALPGDPGHHNVAHPGCSFVVDFWGFDAGQTLNVSFAGQAPTGAGTPLTLSGSGTSVTSPDDAGGGNDPRR
jgi:hypothetical protein